MIGVAAGAVAWLALIWYAAPLLSRKIEPLAERARQALVLICGIGFVLGFTRELDALGCWAAVVALAALRVARFRELPDRTDEGAMRSPIGYAAVLGATALGAWPSLVRPITDGDSLIYHLPNAVSWVAARSVFVTDTHYWWYPGGSELVAAVLLCVGGLPLVPLAGAGAFAFLGFVVVDWCRERGLGDETAAALAFAFVTSRVALVQSGDLQNDVWLTAFFAAGLYRMKRGEPQAQTTLAVLALLKPIGPIYALALAAGAPRNARRMPWLAMSVFALWALRDAILAPHAVLPFPPLLDSGQAGTSIAAHGVQGLRVLFESAFNDGVATFALLVLALACAAFARTRLAAAAAFALLAFIFIPFGFESDGIAQLAGGFTLRFALPALAVGLFALAAWLGGRPVILQRFVAFACAVVGCINARSFVLLYWNDANTHAMWLVAIVTFAASWFALRDKRRPQAARRKSAAFATCALLAGVLYAWRIQGDRPPIGYYRDTLGETGLTGSLPAYLVAWPSGTVVTVGFPLGMFDVLAPRSRGVDGVYTGDVCSEARNLHATLVVHEAGARGAGILGSLEHCGKTVWHNAFDESIAP